MIIDVSPHINTFRCDNCNSDRLSFDQVHAEIICRNCYLVLEERMIISSPLWSKDGNSVGFSQHGLPYDPMNHFSIELTTMIGNDVERKKWFSKKKISPKRIAIRYKH